jgi:hypothetical protein
MLAVEMIDAVLLFYESGALHQIPTRAGEAVCSPVDAAFSALRADKATVVAAGDLAVLLSELGESETDGAMS